MALALDNYPAGSADPYSKVSVFPDGIMRKDILDELQPPGQTELPKAPPPASCPKCVSAKVTLYIFVVFCKIMICSLEDSSPTV